MRPIRRFILLVHLRCVRCHGGRRLVGARRAEGQNDAGRRHLLDLRHRCCNGDNDLNATATDPASRGCSRCPRALA